MGFEFKGLVVSTEQLFRDAFTYLALVRKQGTQLSIRQRCVAVLLEAATTTKDLDYTAALSICVSALMKYEVGLNPSSPLQISE